MIDLAEIWGTPPEGPVSIAQLYGKLRRIMQFENVANQIDQEIARQYWISKRYREHNASGDGKPGLYRLLQGPLPEQNFPRYMHAENFFWEWIEKHPLWVRDVSGKLLRVDGAVSKRKSLSYKQEWEPDEPFYMMAPSFRIWLDPALRFIALSDAISGGRLSPFYSVSKSMEAAARKAIEVRAVVNQLSPFDGKEVFILHEDVPDANDLKRAFWLHLPDRSDAAVAAVALEGRALSVGGRPRKMEAAYEAYSRQFPNGHVGYPWKSVRERLRVEEDIIVSEATLRAAIAAYSDDQADRENL